MGKGRVIGLVSGKGGVGKTTVCVNLGVALRKMGADVTIVDADFSASNLGVHLGRYDHPVKMQKVLNGEADIESAIFRHPAGIKAITSSNEIHHVEPDIQQLKTILHKAAAQSDYVLVDCPPGLNQTVETIMHSCEEIVIVTTPTQTAGINAAQIIQKAKQIQKPVLGTILNKIEGDPSRELVEREVEMMTESHIISKIPHDKHVKESLFEYTPLISFEPLAEASIEIHKLASDLTGVDYEEPSFAKFKRKFKKLKTAIKN